mmetsp:Transcript_43519/g.93210  ORF Transcript_43519/g.93210 Transcript_43519/m.93210 type:complete len:447 (-) Transcript_43519:21-1361(-)
MLSARRGSSLSGAGQGVVLGVLDNVNTPRVLNAVEHRDTSSMSIEEMEAQLQQKLGKRPTEQLSARNGGRARGVLEENRKMIEEKQERKAIARQNSKEEFEELISKDRLQSEGEKARELSRRSAQRELAMHYKERIGAKQQPMVQRYQNKKAADKDYSYFPFVEGENIRKDREAKRVEMREEMRGFLEKQRQEKPPRKDKLLSDVRGPSIDYPVEPLPNFSGNASIIPGTHVGFAPPTAEDSVSPHMARHPRFLSRASEHMSRRHHDAHVRKALEDKVEQTKRELEAANAKRDAEMQQWQSGLFVSDALKSDKEQARRNELRRNAETLQKQIEEQKNKQVAEKQAYRQDKTGYWGPENKPPLNPAVHKAHCDDLIKQMEVDQVRRQYDKLQQLKQERQLIDNCMAELSCDRQKELQKQIQHREVLTTTWQSQQKIKRAIDGLESMA